MSDLEADTSADPFARFPTLPADGYATHEVMNQASPLTGHNAFTGDRLLTTGNAGNSADAELFDKLGLKPMHSEEPARLAAE